MKIEVWTKIVYGSPKNQESTFEHHEIEVTVAELVHLVEVESQIVGGAYIVDASVAPIIALKPQSLGKMPTLPSVLVLMTDYNLGYGAVESVEWLANQFREDRRPPIVTPREMADIRATWTW